MRFYDVRMTAALFLLSFVSHAFVQPTAKEESDSREVITSIFKDLGVTDFRFRKTKHFIIGYDTSDEFIRPHVGRLEGIYGAVSRFCEANGFQVEGLGPLPIIFFNKFETFARYAQKLEMPSEGIAGFYHQSNNVAAFVNASDIPAIRGIADHLQSMHKQLSEARSSAKSQAARAAASAIENTIYTVSAQRDSIVEMFNRFVLQHEAAHQILFNAGVHPRGAASPQWLVEGLACQFEVPQPDPSGGLRGVNQMRLADLREAMGIPPNGQGGSKVDVSSLPASGKLIPLKQLVSGDVFESVDPRLKPAYAQSWALVLYLHRTSHDSLRDYLHKLANREVGTRPDPEADLAEFEAAFGPIDAKLDQSLADFIIRLPSEP